MAKQSGNMLGSYAFIGGVILSVILGVVVAPNALWLGLLAILGLVVALLNITDREVHGYLLANIAVIVGASAFNAMLITLAAPLNLGAIATTLSTMTGNLVFFVAPGAVIIALKEIWNIAREA